MCGITLHSDPFPSFTVPTQSALLLDHCRSFAFAGGSSSPAIWVLGAMPRPKRGSSPLFSTWGFVAAAWSAWCLCSGAQLNRADHNSML